MTLKKFLDNFEEYFCVWTLVLMTSVVFLQVIMRYVFHNSLSWSDELARYIFLWLSWIGASYAVKTRDHFRVEMFADMIKGKDRILFEYLILAIWFIFSIMLVWYGTKLLVFLHGTGQVSAAMEIPMTWAYAAVPAGCILMCVRLVIEIHKLRAGIYNPETKKEEKA